MRHFRKRNFTDEKRNRTWKQDRPFGPNPETVSAPTARGTSEWTVRQFGNKLKLAPVSLLLDPTKEAVEVAQPYPIINSNNVTLERKYEGVPNTNGLIINDITINPHSKLVKEFDSGKLDIKIAYQFLNMGKTAGKGKKITYVGAQPYTATNFQYQTAFDDGRSRVAAELWMDSSFNRSTFKSNIPQMENAMTSSLIYYQVFLQNLATVMAKYNQLTLLQQDLINMGYGRESSILVELFSRMGKTTFLNKWLTLAKDLEEEYFDTKWFSYVNAINNVPSRKTNSTRDPLLTVTGVHEMPEISIALNDTDTPYFESNKLKARIYYYDPDKVDTSKRPDLRSSIVSMEEFFWYTINLLDQNNILNWARKLYVEDEHDKFTYADGPDQLMNMISLQIDEVIKVVRKFKQAFQDMKVFLNIAKRAGLIKWEQRTQFDLYKAKITTSAVNNINIRDIIIASCAAPSKINFNYNTQKWGFYSLWDEYDGIPLFDTNNGGMDILFSVKRDITGISYFEEDALELCLPYLFKHTNNSKVITMINRDSDVINIQSMQLTGDQVASNIALSRLIPKNGLTGPGTDKLLTVPYVVMPSHIENRADTISTVVRLLTHLFKMGNVKVGEGEIHTYVNPTLICLVDGEMQSAAENTMKHIRSNVPLTGVSNQ